MEFVYVVVIAIADDVVAADAIDTCIHVAESDLHSNALTPAQVILAEIYGTKYFGTNWGILVLAPGTSSFLLG